MYLCFGTMFGIQSQLFGRPNVLEIGYLDKKGGGVAASFACCPKVGRFRMSAATHTPFMSGPLSPTHTPTTVLPTLCNQAQGA